MVDRTLAKHNEELATRAVIAEDLDARLVLIDPSQNIDKYYVLQGLEDPSLEGSDERFYSYQHWGRTGAAGDGKLEGPSSLSEVKDRLHRVFKDKSGCEWGSIERGARAPPGKYWLQRQAAPDLKAKWEYYVDDGVDGKRPGWYPYAEEASEQVESIFAQHEANERESRTASRVIDSGYFSYKVDLENLTQQNTRTGKRRTIRRVLGSGPGSQAEAAPAPLKAMKSRGSPPRPAMKARVEPMKAMASTRSMKATKRPATTGKAMKAMKAARAMKTMKATKAMKVMKAMKVKKAMKAMKSVIAKGKRARAKVWRGTKEKTATGFRKADLMKNKSGKIVTKKGSARGKAQFKNVAKWIGACKQARDVLGLKGFVAVKKGTALYMKAKELYPDAEPYVLA
eukprot:TRINITY_DN96675_c0_g1_i1.p1 TRINITY_DN96675_c0_g1~~TRINITY_DN96675_c0_g1_i1.p1  ORF type:complete len:413 (-),score=109.05 TRINITY_DN96675_c0_g1_i1:71-1261(-)